MIGVLRQPFLHRSYLIGDVGGCRKARKGKLKRVLTVSTDQNGSVERLRIRKDPCDAT